MILVFLRLLRYLQDHLQRCLAAAVAVAQMFFFAKCRCLTKFEPFSLTQGMHNEIESTTRKSASQFPSDSTLHCLLLVYTVVECASWVQSNRLELEKRRLNKLDEDAAVGSC